MTRLKHVTSTEDWIPSGARKKEANLIVSKLRVALQARDLDRVRHLLCGSADEDLFIRIREQKLLLRAASDQRDSFAEILRTASLCMDSAKQTNFGNYLTFALEVDAKRLKCLERLHASFADMPRCSLVDLLVVSEDVLISCLERQFASHLSPAGISVAEYERRLHDRNGAALDLSMAIARMANEYGRVALGPPEGRLTRAQRRKVHHMMRRAVSLAGEANSLEFFFDSVTYGELAVEKINDDEQPRFRFHFVDARRYLLKALAIRRLLARRNARRSHPRYLRERLRELEEPVLKQAVVDYLTCAKTSKRVEIDLEQALRQSGVLLLDVDTEDDLLLAASRFGARTVAHYVVAMVMRWYCIAAKVVRDAPQVRARTLSAAPVTVDDILRRISGIDAGPLSEAFGILTSEFPARSHVTLTELGFVKDGVGVARPILAASTSNWSCAVRKSLIQGGAIGKSVGAVWEDFYAQNFDGTDWKLVGRAVKLRTHGKTLTDVDLLLIREDLLLVMQVKALIGAANTSYDHWRNRETVRVGCAQGRVAADFLLANPQTLVSVCGKRLAARVKHIQPVVLTNINELDGWRVDNVPVIGEVTRKAICRGARVDYETSTGEVIHTHHVVKPGDLNTSTILQLFDEPLEMRVALEGVDVSHIVHRIGGLTLEMPEFLNRPDAEQVPEADVILERWTKRNSGTS